MKFSKLILIFIVTLLIKFSFVIYFSHLQRCQTPDSVQGYITIVTGDTPSYTGAIDNFIEKRTYYFWNGKRQVYAGRLPHYGTPYYFTRLIFKNKAVASDIYIIFQIIADALATLFFALLCFQVIGNKWSFWIGYTLYFLNFNLFLLTLQLLPESLSLSFFVIFLYFFHIYWKKDNWNYCLISSILLALVVVLKPYLVLLYIPYFLIIFTKTVNSENGKLISSIRKIIILSLPLILILLPWIIRNEIVLNKFIPAQESTTAGYDYTEADLAYRKFVTAWGGNIIPWDPQAAGCYFYNKSCSFKLPEYALTNSYTIYDVEDARREYVEYLKDRSSLKEKKATEKFERLTSIYKSEKPFMYYVGSKFLIAKHILWHTNNSNLPISPTFRCYKSYQLVFKLIQLLIHILSMILGTLGLFTLFYKRKINFLIFFVPIFLIIFFSLLGVPEARYFNHAYPIMIIGLTYVLYLVFRAVKIFSTKN